MTKLAFRGRRPRPPSTTRAPGRQRFVGRALTAVATVGLTAATLATAVSAPASADPRCANNDPYYGYCVGGRILQEFNEAGGLNFFGNAVRPESNALNGGKWQAFAKGSSIYWKSDVSGGHANQVGGVIRDKWGSLGYEGGALGYPTTRERPTRKPGRFNKFQGGSVYWSQATGAHTVFGKIFDEWASRDYENGSLGFPTSDEYADNGGRSQNFQGGKLQWFPTVGDTLPAPVNMGSYGTYSMDFQLFSPPKTNPQTPADVLHEVVQNFDRYFTFTGCGPTVYVGKECRLNTTASPDAPVRITAVSDDGFSILSLPGHPEGADRKINFKFYYAYISSLGQYEVRMRVEAWGPLNNSSLLGPLNSETVARQSWQIFQNNLRDRISGASTIYVRCCGYEGTGGSGGPTARSTATKYPGPVKVIDGADDKVIRPGPAKLDAPPGVVPLYDPKTKQLVTRQNGSQATPQTTPSPAPKSTTTAPKAPAQTSTTPSSTETQPTSDAPTSTESSQEASPVG